MYAKEAVGDVADMEKFRIKDPALRRRAAVELGETDEIRTASLIELKNRIQNDPRICGDMKDELLVAYLRTTKFNVNAAYNRVKKVAQTLSHPLAQQWLKEHSGMENVLHVLKEKWILFPEEYDSESKKIVSILLGPGWNPDQYSLGQIIVSVLLMALAEVLDERCQIGGLVVVLDLKHLGLKHMKQVSPTFIYLLGTLLKDCLPVRIKQFHVANLPAIAYGFAKILLSYFGEKMRSRYLVYRHNFSAKNSTLPVDLLHKDLGGTYKDREEDSNSRHVHDIVEKTELLGVYQNFRDLKYV